MQDKEIRRILIEYLKIKHEEKHAVWQNILDNSEDCLIPKRRFNLSPRWLHPFLREYIKIDNYLMKEFFRGKPNAVYFLPRVF